MKIIFADFNAKTESESIRLACLGSQEDLQRHGIKAGDWVWLSDGEMQVGARVEVDPRYGLIGVPAWDTLIDLVDDPPVSLASMMEELGPLLQNADVSLADERRVRQLLTWWCTKSPNDALLAHHAARRQALAVSALGLQDLALTMFDDLLEIDPTDESTFLLHLELLTKLDPPRALRTTEERLAHPKTSPLLGDGVKTIAIEADQGAGTTFHDTCRRLLNWQLGIAVGCLRDHSCKES